MHFCREVRASQEFIKSVKRFNKNKKETVLKTACYLPQLYTLEYKMIDINKFYPNIVYENNFKIIYETEYFNDKKKHKDLNKNDIIQFFNKKYNMNILINDEFYKVWNKYIEKMIFQTYLEFTEENNKNKIEFDTTNKNYELKNTFKVKTEK